MIEEVGVVATVAGGRASIMRSAAKTCGACKGPGHCGTSVLQAFFYRRQAPLEAFDPVGARPGDRVLVGIDERVLQRATWIAFLLPLLGLIGGGMLGDWQAVDPGNGELAAVAGGLTGLIVGLLAARKLCDFLLGDTQRQVRILCVVSRGPVLHKLSRAQTTAAFSEKK